VAAIAGAAAAEADAKLKAQQIRER
jgi:hypothetical protein